MKAAAHCGVHMSFTGRVFPQAMLSVMPEVRSVQATVVAVL
jgi:hypothetical protein